MVSVIPFLGDFIRDCKLNVVRIVSGIAAESVMVLGYFGYACLLLQQGLAAAASIPGNVVQGVVGIVLGIALCEALQSNKQIRHFLERIR